MKFLCLHGIGENNHVFKLRTSAFRYELADQHTYEYVQASIPWQETSDRPSASAQGYTWYEINSQESYDAAVKNLDAYIAAEGPFDGVMAYSQGAGLIATLLLRKQWLHPERPPIFRCAILFSPVQAYEQSAWLDRGEVAMLDGTALIKSTVPIPVAVIYGSDDEMKAQCRGIQAICDPTLLSLHVHANGHEFPGIKDKNGLLDAVKVARQCITRAEMSVSG